MDRRLGIPVAVPPYVSPGEGLEAAGLGIFYTFAAIELVEFAAPAAAYSWARWGSRGPASPPGNLVNASVEEEATVEAPYAHLKDGPKVGPDKDFTASQKEKIIQANRLRNGGPVRADNADDNYPVLIRPEKSQKGVEPAPNEWQIDHHIPRSQGGSNSFSNARVTSRHYNRLKWDKPPGH